MDKFAALKEIIAQKIVAPLKEIAAQNVLRARMWIVVALAVGALWLAWLLWPARLPAAVATAHPLATRAAVEMLERGGNAFDAAVAAGAALAVVEPSGSGFGGGGFWLLHRAKEQTNLMLDAREKAPLAAHADMYLDAAGEVMPRASLDGALAAGIPGHAAALVWLSENYGALPLAEALAPAIAYAENGFNIGARLHRLLQFRLPAVAASPAAAEIFLRDGEALAEGDLLQQTDLAATLRRLAAHGHDGFYAGETAQQLVDGVRAAGGIWELEDLAQYEVVARAPVVAAYRDMQMISAALPSSGGLVLAQTLNILSGYDWARLTEVERAHLVVEAWRRAYRDRAEYMGDADFVEVPQAMIASPLYAAGQRQSIRLDRATQSAALAPTAPPAPGGDNTTHFSIVDAEGNRVAATLSINYPFGSGFVAPGTGVVLNNEMDDFSAKPGAPNVYGLVGAKANAIAPGKRMLSSMTPTFLERGARMAVVGTPGGSRIISMLALAALAFYDGKGAAEIVKLPRFHHQYLPDVVQYEADAFDDEMLNELRARGHEMKLRERPWGNMQAVVVDDGEVQAASDPRGEGAARVVE